MNKSQKLISNDADRALKLAGSTSIFKYLKKKLTSNAHKRKNHRLQN